VKLDSTGVRLDDFARDRQAEATAAIAGAGLIDLIEALEHALGLLGRDIRASIVDRQKRGSRRALAASRRGDWPADFNPYRHGHAAAKRRVLEGVFDQVVEHLADAVRVAQDADWIWRGNVEADAALLSAEQKARLGGPRELGQIQRLTLQRQVARLDAAQIQQVFDEAPHTLGFFADDAARFACALGARDSAVNERARETADGR
jgi:hypothetical protein